MSSLNAVAVDVGYGYTKAVAADGARVSFPSVVAPAPADIFGGLYNGGPGHRVRIRRADGQAAEWLVGEAAARSAAAIHTLSRHKPQEMHDLLILAAAYLVGAGAPRPGGGQVDLAVGLPLAYYKSQRDALAARLRGLAAWVSADGGEERYVSAGRVLVLPQGAGAAAACRAMFPDGLAGVVDVGQYTTDYLLLDIDGPKKTVPVLEACGSTEAGVYLIHRAVSDAFRAVAGAPLPLGMIERALRDGHVIYEDRPLDLSAAVGKAMRDTAQTISQRVLAAWGPQASFVRATLLVGGGAALLCDRLAACLPQVIVPDDPVTANAWGFLAALQEGSGRP